MPQPPAARPLPTLALVALLGAALPACATTVRGQGNVRYLGEFPAHLGDLVATARRAERSIDVITDLAAYGFFSSPAEAEALIATLEARRGAGVRVRLVALAPDRLRALLEHGLPDAAFDALKKSGKVDAFAAREGLPPIADGASLRRAVMTVEAKVQARLRVLGDDLRVLDHDMPLLAWIVDGKDALFAIDLDLDNSENAFHSADPNLLGELQRIFDGHFAQAAIVKP